MAIAAKFGQGAFVRGLTLLDITFRRRRFFFATSSLDSVDSGANFRFSGNLGALSEIETWRLTRGLNLTQENVIITTT